MRRFFVLVLITCLSACAGESDIDTSLQRDEPLAQARVFSFVTGAPATDTLVTLEDMNPVAFGLVPSPGLTAFRPVIAGHASATLTLDGNVAASAEHDLVEGARYTIVHWGDLSDGAPLPAATRWLAESFEPLAGKTRVRLALGADLPVALASLGPATLATQPAWGDVGVFMDVDPGSYTLELRDEHDALLASFGPLEFGDGGVRTLVIVSGDESSPIELYDVAEHATGAPQVSGPLVRAQP